MLGILCKIVLWATIVSIIAVYPTQVFSAPQALQARLEDGVVLKVHIQEDLGEEGFAYAQQVLQAACTAYKEIVFKQGFNRAGYSFAHSTRDFAYDSDRAIDIYIEDIETPYTSMQPQVSSEYKAEIFVPADYQGYQERYKIDHPQLELKASLTHELLHIITYSYNRNMEATSHGKVSLTSGRWDWYTEGLARYFEKLAGYEKEFLSCGFRKKCDKKIMVYKGGVNYFLEYPDKPLNERKYDFALFWQYLHQNYGMDKIEEISFKFREIDPELCTNCEAMQIIARSLDIPLKNLLRNFSLYVYRSSSLAYCREDGFHPVSISEVSPEQEATYSISSFGFDLYEVDLKEVSGTVHLKTIDSHKNLSCLIGIRSPFNFVSMPVESDGSGRITIDTTSRYNNSKMIIMLSNPTNQKIYYRIMLD